MMSDISDRVANVYFTSDVDVKSRMSGLNEFYRINLNDVRRAGAHDDGVFNECKISDQESDDDIASINSKDNDDDADDDKHTRRHKYKYYFYCLALAYPTSHIPHPTSHCYTAT